MWSYTRSVYICVNKLQDLESSEEQKPNTEIQFLSVLFQKTTNQFNLTHAHMHTQMLIMFLLCYLKVLVLLSSTSVWVRGSTGRFTAWLVSCSIFWRTWQEPWQTWQRRSVRTPVTSAARAKMWEKHLMIHFILTFTQQSKNNLLFIMMISSVSHLQTWR